VPTIELFNYVSKLLEVQLDEKLVNSAYRQLCDYVHSNLKAIVSLGKLPKEDIPDSDGFYKIYFKTPSSYNKEQVDELAYLPLLVIMVTEKIFSDYLSEGQKNKIRDYCVSYQFEQEKK
jgi:hypothetical protein